MVRRPYPRGAASEMGQATRGSLNLSFLMAESQGSGSFSSLLLGKQETIKENLKSRYEVDSPKLKALLIFAGVPCPCFSSWW